MKTQQPYVSSGCDVSLTITALTLASAVAALALEFLKGTKPSCNDSEHSVTYLTGAITLGVIPCALADRTFYSLRHDLLPLNILTTIL